MVDDGPHQPHGEGPVKHILGVSRPVRHLVQQVNHLLLVLMRTQYTQNTRKLFIKLRFHALSIAFPSPSPLIFLPLLLLACLGFVLLYLLFGAISLVNCHSSTTFLLNSYLHLPNLHILQTNSYFFLETALVHMSERFWAYNLQVLYWLP